MSTLKFDKKFGIIYEPFPQTDMFDLNFEIFPFLWFGQKPFGSTQILRLKNFVSKGNYEYKKIFRPKQIFSSKRIWGLKIFWAKKAFWVEKTFRVQNKFVSKIFLRENKDPKEDLFKTL